jgi:hypothetical protein
MNLKLIIGLIIIVGIIIVFAFDNYFEQFEPVSSNQQYSEFSNYIGDNDKNLSEYYSQLDYKKIPNINCCLVKKKYLPSSTGLYQGDFIYTYKIKSGDECNSSNYNLDSNNQILIDGENGWSNNFCNNQEKKLGSCRNINKECIDFVDKDFCDKYRMKWSSKTCHQPLEYTWIDPIKISSTKSQLTDSTFKMF